MNRLNPTPAPPPPPQGPLGMAPQGGVSPQGNPTQSGAMPPQSPPTRDQIVEAIQKTHYINDGLRLLLNKEGGPSRSDVIDETGHLISEGILSPQQAAQELQSLPSDNGQIKIWLQQHIVNSTVARGKLLGMLAPGGGQQGAMPDSPQMAAPPMQNALTAGMPQGG